MNYALAGGLVLLCACSPGADLKPIADYKTTGYKLGGGDQVRVITFGEDQLTGDFRVDDQGDIALPLVGSIHAAGLTPTQLATSVGDELRRRHLISDPSVAVEVASYRPVFVLGEVSKPGQYPYQPGMTMLTTVAVAGGFTYRGVQDYASVVRTTGDKAAEGRITPLSFVAPGDVINVYERRF
ncbi:MAG: polysaccharide biosynthesis/export family protein [Acetobacteraceae bacterium]